jgi:hypothetical protein
MRNRPNKARYAQHCQLTTRPFTFFMTRVKGSLTYRDRYDSRPLSP